MEFKEQIITSIDELSDEEIVERVYCMQERNPKLTYRQAMDKVDQEIGIKAIATNSMEQRDYALSVKRENTATEDLINSIVGKYNLRKESRIILDIFSKTSSPIECYNELSDRLAGIPKSGMKLVLEQAQNDQAKGCL